jgi:hypothetical protein
VQWSLVRFEGQKARYPAELQNRQKYNPDSMSGDHCACVQSAMSSKIQRLVEWQLEAR